MDDEQQLPRLDLGRLERGLFADAGSGAGLEVGDPRLDAVTDAAFKSQLELAAAEAQQIWDAGVRDVRVVGYLLFGHFVARGLVGLPWLLEQLLATLTTQWEAIGPANKSKSADGALNWLFQSLVRRLSSHEQLKDEQYQTWSSAAGLEAFAAAVATSGRLIEEVAKLFPQGKSLDKLRNLEGWLREREATLQQEAARERRAAEQQAAAVKAEEEAEVAKAEARAQAVAESRTVTPTAAVTVEGAAALGLLMRKIRLFERLMEEGSVQKAAVVARDVDHVLQNFDPVVFLPKLCVPFFRLMSKSMERLEPAIAELEAPSFKSLVQLYQADLDAFAEP